MYAILIWNNLEEDFIYYREDGKRVTFASWADANDKAAVVNGNTGEQTRVQFVRDTKRAKKTNRNGRLQRFRAVQFDGEWVRSVGTFNTKGKKVDR